MNKQAPEFVSLLPPLLVFTSVSIGLYVARVIMTEVGTFSFLNWNLVLAWLPIFWVWLLIKWLSRGRWLSLQGLVLSALWLIFLPNSFYLVSDFIHLRLSDDETLLYDGVMLMSYALSGLILAWVSVWAMHQEMVKRITARETWYILTAVFLLSSFAVYMGRYLRWNSWDILLDPFSILFDVSDRVINPSAYPNTFITTALFFVFISGTYYGFHWLITANYRDNPGSQP